MEDKTLTQIKETMNISRRAIQGYEKEGLVTPSGKTKRGYLLYDQEAQDRIQMIKFLQDIGFELKQIKAIIDAPANQKRQELMKKRKELVEQETHIKQLVKQVDELINRL